MPRPKHSRRGEPEEVPATELVEEAVKKGEPVSLPWSDEQMNSQVPSDEWPRVSGKHREEN